MAGIRDGRPPREAAAPASVTQVPAAIRAESPTRPATAPHASRPAAAPKARPDARPLRIAFGFAAVATASALATALATAAQAGPASSSSSLAGQDQTPVRHVVRYVQLAPGQTAPPQSQVQAAPVQPPKRVVVVTRQSGG